MKKTQALTIVIHVTGWMLFLCIPVFFVSQNQRINYPLLSLKIFLFGLYYVAFFYTNIWQLIPKLYLKKKQVFYFSLMAILLVATIFLKPFDRLIANPPRSDGQTENFNSNPPPLRSMDMPPPASGDRFGPRPRKGSGPMRPPNRMIFDIISIVLFLLVWAVGYALQLVSLWKNTESRAVQAEAERAKAELSFLKARIHPHFLFNTLNNIYSMALISHDQTAASILRLSNIMRYITDDVVNDFVPLDNELQCVDNYISLQKLRLNKNTPVNYKLTGDTGNKLIAPLILMPFVENVFKYGVSNHQLSLINLKVEIASNALYFYATNRIVPAQLTQERSGIGIANTRQRLALLYPERHLLLIKETEELYTVELTIYFDAIN